MLAGAFAGIAVRLANGNYTGALNGVTNGLHRNTRLCIRWICSRYDNSLNMLWYYLYAVRMANH